MIFIEIRINKEVRNYQEGIFFGLSLRQCIFSALAILVAVGAYFTVRCFAIMQHTYCTATTWEDALPGDLVFYADDSHVGIFAGWDEDGDAIIIHCAMGYNNVVMTGQEAFAEVGVPEWYG